MTETYSADCGIFRKGDEVVITQRIKAYTLAFREKNRQYIDIPKGTQGRVLDTPITTTLNQVPIYGIDTVYGKIVIPEYFLDYA